MVPVDVVVVVVWVRVVLVVVLVVEVVVVLLVVVVDDEDVVEVVMLLVLLVVVNVVVTGTTESMICWNWDPQYMDHNADGGGPIMLLNGTNAWYSHLPSSSKSSILEIFGSLSSITHRGPLLLPPEQSLSKYM